MPLLLLTGALGLLISWALYCLFLLPRFSTLRNLPGPGPPRGILGLNGHLPQILDTAKSKQVHESYVKSFGRTYRIKGVGNWEDRLISTDPVALTHVMNHTNNYQKPWQSRRFITRLIGEGMLAAEGLVHKRMRRVGTPAFAPRNMDALVPVVFLKAYELKDRWMQMIAMSSSEVVQDKKSSSLTIDVCHWISRATFDVIGLAGFDYNFSAIQNESNELFLAYKEMFEIAVSQSGGIKDILIIYFPWLEKLFPDRKSRVVKQSQEIIYRIGGKLVQDRKDQIRAAAGKGESTGKDFLSMMLKSNMSQDTPPAQRLSDADILNNLNTFFFAGSDTSSLALTWTLFLLAAHPELQLRLREELKSLSHGYYDLSKADPGQWEAFWPQIEGLPFLDKVIRESLRLIPPVHSSIRVAMKDDDIPTSEPIRMRDGSVKMGVHIPKGTFVHIPVESINTDKEVWGENAWAFNPDRWDNLPDSVQAQPGLYSHILTFSSGPRSCIGLRFSLIEMKTFLYVLLTEFEFSMATEKVFPANVVLTRPYVSGKFKEGSQCPLVVTPILSSSYQG